jgi:tripartite ATP-independent transporter DctM subunit
MRRASYHPALKAGTIAAGSTLGVVIPPSIVLVVYGLHTRQSIGKLFAGSLVPSILLTVGFVVTVLAICRFRPEWGPAGAASTWREKLRSLPQVLDVVVLFAVVMAALFSGKVTPTEAAGVSTLLGIGLCVVRRRLSWRAFGLALRDTVRISCMVFMIMAGAVIFGRFLTMTRLPFVVADTVGGLNLPGPLILTAMLVVYVIGGCVMDALAFLLISLPIFMPLVEQLGYDPVWFGELVCVVTTLGAITPPVGVCCFVVAGMSRDVSLSQVFRGATLYLPAYALTLVAMILWPEWTVVHIAALVR